MHNVFEILSVYIIQVHVPVIHGNLRSILLSIPQVKGDFSRIVQEDSEGLFFGKYQKIMGRIERMGVFSMVRVIGAVTGIDPAPFINAPDLLAQAIYRPPFSHFKGNFFSFFYFYTRDLTFFNGVVFYYRLCIQRISETKFMDHLYLLSAALTQFNAL